MPNLLTAMTCNQQAQQGVEASRTISHAGVHLQTASSCGQMLHVSHGPWEGFRRLDGSSRQALLKSSSLCAVSLAVFCSNGGAGRMVILPLPGAGDLDRF